MFISSTGIFIFCVALFFLGVRNEENTRIAKEQREAREEKEKERK